MTHLWDQESDLFWQVTRLDVLDWYFIETTWCQSNCHIRYFIVRWAGTPASGTFHWGLFVNRSVLPWLLVLVDWKWQGLISGSGWGEGTIYYLLEMLAQPIGQDGDAVTCRPLLWSIMIAPPCLGSYLVEVIKMKESKRQNSIYQAHISVTNAIRYIFPRHWFLLNLGLFNPFPINHNFDLMLFKSFHKNYCLRETFWGQKQPCWSIRMTSSFVVHMFWCHWECHFVATN